MPSCLLFTFASMSLNSYARLLENRLSVFPSHSSLSALFIASCFLAKKASHCFWSRALRASTSSWEGPPCFYLNVGWGLAEPSSLALAENRPPTDADSEVNCVEDAGPFASSRGLNCSRCPSCFSRFIISSEAVFRSSNPPPPLAGRESGSGKFPSGPAGSTGFWGLGLGFAFSYSLFFLAATFYFFFSSKTHFNSSSFAFSHF